MPSHDTLARMNHEFIDFNDKELTEQMVLAQLSYGVTGDDPVDWVLDTWESLRKGRAKANLEAGVLSALRHKNAKTRARALQVLEKQRTYNDPAAIATIARKGFKRHFAGVGTDEFDDLGKPLARLVAHLPFAKLSELDIDFIKSLAAHPDYSTVALTGLCRRMPDWVAANVMYILQPSIAEQQLQIIFSRFKRDDDRLRQAVLAAKPNFEDAVRQVAHDVIKSADQREALGL